MFMYKLCPIKFVSHQWIYVLSLDIYFRPVRATPEKFENAALFLQLGLPSKLNRHEDGAFRKCSSNWTNLKMTALCFCFDEKHFDNGGFRKR